LNTRFKASSMCPFIALYLSASDFVPNPIAPVGLDVASPDVGSHDQDRILEIYRGGPGYLSECRHPTPAKRIVEDIRMSFLDLIQENNGVRLASDFFRQLPPSSYPNVSRRGTHKARKRRISPCIRSMSMRMRAFFRIEKILGQRLRHFCFADTGWSKENKRSDRSSRVLKGPALVRRIARVQFCDCFILPHDHTSERFFHLQELLAGKTFSASAAGNGG